MRDETSYAIAFLCLAAALGPAPLAGQSAGYAHPIEKIPAERQFDFWLGEWEVQVRRSQDGSWVDQETGTARIYSILGGNAVLELWDGHAPNPSGYTLRGFSLRHYDRASGKWVLALNWPSPNRPSFFQLTGSFRHGRGEFFVSYTDTAGVENILRYTFSDITPVSLRWDDGVSRDGGRTWASSMIFEFSRAQDRVAWPRPGEPAPTAGDGSLCRGREFDGFDFLEGRWEGTFTPAGAAAGRGRAEMTAYRVLGGCAVMSLLEYEAGGAGRQVFEIRSYLPQRGEWVELRLDDRRDSRVEMLGGRLEGGEITFTELAPRGGERPRELSRTRWREMERASVSFELAESSDAGASWAPIGAVELTRR